MNIGYLVKLKMLTRLKLNLKKLQHADVDMPNEEIKADIELHRRLINFMENII